MEGGRARAREREGEGLYACVVWCGGGAKGECREDNRERGKSKTAIPIPFSFSHSKMAASASSALAALAASAADPEALASAIQGAAFLDTTPGDARQQLRGV